MLAPRGKTAKKQLKTRTAILYEVLDRLEMTTNLSIRLKRASKIYHEGVSLSSGWPIAVS